MINDDAILSNVRVSKKAKIGRAVVATRAPSHAPSRYPTLNLVEAARELDDTMIIIAVTQV
jgi:hypothetical protein